jgi:hypothetical protein
MDKEALAYKIVLLAVLQLVKEQGMAKTGTPDGLDAYQVLSEALAQAEAFGLTAADIGLEGFDPDTLLQRSRKAA